MRSIVLLLPVLAMPILLSAGCDRPSTSQGQATAAVNASPGATVPEVDEAHGAPPAVGAADAGRLDRSHRGGAAPGARFAGPDGKPMTLAAFRGRPVLLNLWATWCAPCKGEMPTLDKLAANDKLIVATVSQDLDGAKVVAPYFARARFMALKPYTDTRNALLGALGNATLPTTVLYDSSGKELWRVDGPMDWTGAEAKALLAEAK